MCDLQQTYIQNRTATISSTAINVKDVLKNISSIRVGNALTTCWQYLLAMFWRCTFIYGYCFKGHLDLKATSNEIKTNTYHVKSSNAISKLRPLVAVVENAVAKLKGRRCAPLAAVNVGPGGRKAKAKPRPKRTM